MLAIELQLAAGDLDFRTRLLIRDALHALNDRCGERNMTRWRERSSARRQIDAIIVEELGAPGFPFLGRQLMEVTNRETVMQLLRELFHGIQEPTKLIIGGSIALILSNRLSRHTQVIDVVDELPAAISTQHALLDQLAERYRLRLTHFQSHYLPAGWERRLKSLGQFGELDVLLVDEYDIMLGKLFSKREKDRDDLRVLAGQLEKRTLAARLPEAGQTLLSEPALQKTRQTTGTSFSVNHFLHDFFLPREKACGTFPSGEAVDPEFKYRRDALR